MLTATVDDQPIKLHIYSQLFCLRFSPGRFHEKDLISITFNKALQCSEGQLIDGLDH
ncbi:MAG: hypothetical protein WDZ28_00035 [Simkaniaceae bacterium]